MPVVASAQKRFVRRTRQSLVHHSVNLAIPASGFAWYAFAGSIDQQQSACRETADEMAS